MASSGADGWVRLERRIARWSRGVAFVGAAALLVVAVGTLLDVGLRWGFNSPIRGLNDINGLAVPIVIAACFPLVIAMRQNISIRFLGDALGPAAARWLEVFGSLALLAFVVLVGWQLALHTAEMARSGRTTWQLLIPVTPWWTIATAVVLLCVPIQAVATAVDIARAAAGVAPRRQDLPDEDEDDAR
jgi:TRAP-type C4-dicarboxylate transport system permease small subunit